MKSLIAAIQFFSILPIHGEYSESHFGKSTPWFPVVGTILGLITALVGVILFQLNLSPVLVSIFSIMCFALITGGLHLDGVADSADGLFSHRTQERKLEIMKDSRVGTMGALALIFILALKTTVLYEILTINSTLHTPDTYSPLFSFIQQHWYLSWDAWPEKLSQSLPFILVLISFPTVSRATIGINMFLFSYARPSGSTGVFMKYKQKWFIWFLILFAPILCWTLLGTSGLICAAAGFLLTVLWSRWCTKKLGGVTGDTLGASVEFSETLMLLLFPLILAI